MNELRPEGGFRPEGGSHSIYGVTERRQMAVVADSIQAEFPPAWEIGAGVADSLRQALPDLDDVTIGRVTYAVSVHVATSLMACIMRGTDQARLPSILAGVLAAAGLQMTEQEWKEP